MLELLIRVVACVLVTVLVLGVIGLLILHGAREMNDGPMERTR